MKQPYTERQTERMATCCSEAMFGYAEAVNAFWWAATQQTIDACGEAVRAAVPPKPDDKPKSWFNPNLDGGTFFAPLEARAPAGASQSWFGPSPFMQPAASGFFAAPMPAVSPFDVWLNMFPLSANPTAWPMAYFMLSAGVPKSVAWPTAKANAAMMEAAGIATDHLQTAYASYRSDSGYSAATNVGDWGSLMPRTTTAYWSYSA